MKPMLSSNRVPVYLIFCLLIIASIMLIGSCGRSRGNLELADTLQPVDRTLQPTFTSTPIVESTPTPTVTSTTSLTPSTSSPADVIPTSSIEVVTQEVISNTQVAELVALVNINVRSGPGLSYPIVGSLAQGRRAVIIGKLDDLSWWRIECTPGDLINQCWVSGDSTLTLATNSGAVAIALVPPSPTPFPTFTATTTPTAIPTFTPTALTPTPSVTPTAFTSPTPTDSQRSEPTATWTPNAIRVGYFEDGYTPPPPDSSPIGSQIDIANPREAICLCANYENSLPYLTIIDGFERSQTVTIAKGFHVCIEETRVMNLRFVRPSGQAYSPVLAAPFAPPNDDDEECQIHIEPGAETGRYTVEASKGTGQPTLSSVFTVTTATQPTIYSVTRQGPPGTIFEFHLAGLRSETPLYLLRVEGTDLFPNDTTFLGVLPFQLNARGEGILRLRTESGDVPGRYVVVADGSTYDCREDPGNPNEPPKNCIGRYQYFVQRFIVTP